MRCLERFPLGDTGDTGGGESVQRTRISESLSAVISLSQDAGGHGSRGFQEFLDALGASEGVLKHALKLTEVTHVGDRVVRVTREG